VLNFIFVSEGHASVSLFSSKSATMLAWVRSTVQKTKWNCIRQRAWCRV